MRQTDHRDELVRELCDRLVELGILDEPASGEFDVEWPEQDELGNRAD